MNKYNIEGGINFFEELYKSLDIEENDEDDNKCLITNSPLIDKFVTMICGHKFNYIPLYHDIVNHKKKFNNMEGSGSRLNLNEIRCPYCRTKQKSLLPYYEELGLAKVNGVNFYDLTLVNYNSNYSNKCQYQILNNNFNESMDESSVNKKFITCNKYYATKIAIYNNGSSEPKNYGDDKCYCYIHKKEMIKQYKLQEKQNEKQAKLDAKIKAKEEKEKAKKEEKEKSKEEKKKAKEEKEKSKEVKKEKIKNDEEKNPEIITLIITENYVLGPSIIENQTNGCVQILKSGPNKGLACGCKIVSENMCKRHYLLTYKEFIINN